jgi:monofunctional biosynthetic peptidoglycan transglycosylase
MKIIRQIFKFVAKLMLLFVATSLIAVVVFKYVPVPITPYQIINLFSGDGLNKDWVSYDDVSPYFYRALIVAEDARFYSHNGIDWRAVKAARRHNELYPKKRKRGASTITMQTAKNTFLWHGRNYVRKGLEVYFSYLIEFFWGKKRILEVYGNVVEMGEGMYGIEAASQKYFGKSAKRLTKRQAALIAAILPNPKRWNPARPTAYLSRRASMIQARMNSIGLRD